MNRFPAVAIFLLLPITPGACSDDPAGQDTVADTIVDDAPDVDDSDTAGGEPAVVVNELFTDGGDDWVELYNAGGATADLSGWILQDSSPDHLYALPADTLLPAGVYLLLERDPETGFDFGLGSADSVVIRDADGALIDAIAWVDGDIPATASFGRLPDGAGDFQVLFAPTPGAANQDNPAEICDDGVRQGFEVCDHPDYGGLTCEGLGFAGGQLACVDDCSRIDRSGCERLAPALVINEVSSSDDDRIELHNGTDATVDLGGYTLTDDGGNRYFFPLGDSIAAGAYLVLVSGVDHAFGVGQDDWLELRDPAGALVDRAEWPDGAAEISWCRRPDGVGGFEACAVASFGSPNP